jgi:hypothetical protein
LWAFFYFQLELSCAPKAAPVKPGIAFSLTDTPMDEARGQSHTSEKVARHHLFYTDRAGGGKAGAGIHKEVFLSRASDNSAVKGACALSCFFNTIPFQTYLFILVAKLLLPLPYLRVYVRLFSPFVIRV